MWCDYSYTCRSTDEDLNNFQVKLLFLPFSRRLFSACIVHYLSGLVTSHSPYHMASMWWADWEEPALRREKWK